MKELSSMRVQHEFNPISLDNSIGVTDCFGSKLIIAYVPHYFVIFGYLHQPIQVLNYWINKIHMQLITWDDV